VDNLLKLKDKKTKQIIESNPEEFGPVENGTAPKEINDKAIEFITTNTDKEKEINLTNNHLECGDSTMNISKVEINSVNHSFDSNNSKL
jgi:hypothetical protein